MKISTKGNFLLKEIKGRHRICTAFVLGSALTCGIYCSNRFTDCIRRDGVYAVSPDVVICGKNVIFMPVVLPKRTVLVYNNTACNRLRKCGKLFVRACRREGGNNNGVQFYCFAGAADKRIFSGKHLSAPGPGGNHDFIQ